MEQSCDMMVTLRVCMRQVGLDADRPSNGQRTRMGRRYIVLQNKGVGKRGGNKKTSMVSLKRKRLWDHLVLFCV